MLEAADGPAAFSLAEASRRLGVAASAPYRHFADRDALLAAVALRAAGLFREELARRASDGPAPQRLAAAAETYVRFADEQRALFQALAGSGLDKERHPEIGRAARDIGAVFLSPAAELANGDQAADYRATQIDADFDTKVLADMMWRRPRISPGGLVIGTYNPKGVVSRPSRAGSGMRR